jgi:hypothetical protein
MDDYKKKYLKYKNKYFELINRRILTGGSQQTAWLNLRYPSGAYNNAPTISGIMKSECNTDGFKFGEIRNNLLGFLFWLDSWHDFLQGRAKVDIRETTEYKISNNPKKHILTKTNKPLMLEDDKKNIIDNVLEGIFPGKHVNSLVGFANWKEYMNKSISSNSEITKIGSFERTIENYFEEKDCFNYIKSINEGVTIKMDIPLWKSYAKNEPENSLIEKVTKMMEQGDKILIFEYDNGTKEILKKIKTALQNGVVNSSVVFKNDDFLVKAIEHIQNALVKFLNINIDDLSVGIDAGLGQFKPFFYNKLKLHDNQNGTIKKLITPQIKGDSAMTGGSNIKKGPIWIQDTEKKNTITNITLTQSNNEIKLWELHSTVCTSPHFIRWFYKNSDSNDSKCNNTDKDLFEMWITPSSNIVNNVIKEENNVWKSCFKKNMSRGLSVKELSFLIEQTYHSIDQNDFNERIDIFFDVFKEDEGHFDIGDILKKLYDWGRTNLNSSSENFWNPPSEAYANILNIQRFIILFLLDYKRAGDYEQAYSAKFLITNENTKEDVRGQYENLSTTGDIIAGLVYRILKIPLYTVRSTRDLIFSTGKELEFQPFIEKSLEGLNSIYDKIKDKIFKTPIEINLSDFKHFSIITQTNIKLLKDLIGELKGNVTEFINNIIDTTKLENEPIFKISEEGKIELTVTQTALGNPEGTTEAEKGLYTNNLTEEIKKKQKPYKIIFNEIKKKLNKLNYLFDFMEDWCNPQLPEPLLKGEQNVKSPNPDIFILNYSISKFLGLKVLEFIKLKKKLDKQQTSKGLPPSIEYYFYKLKEEMYKNDPNSKTQKSANDFYKKWHTNDGLTNLNKTQIRVGDGNPDLEEGEAKNHLHFFNKTDKNGQEMSVDLGKMQFWEKEFGDEDKKSSYDYNKIHFWWEGPPPKHPTEKGDGLKISTLNLIDNNIILHEALNIVKTEINVVRETGAVTATIQNNDIKNKLKFLTEFSILINNLKIVRKHGFWNEEEDDKWISSYRPIFTTHFGESNILRGAEGSILTDYSQTIANIEEQKFKLNGVETNFTWMLENPANKEGDWNEGLIDVNFAYKGLFINTEKKEMFNDLLTPGEHIEKIKESILELYNKATSRGFPMGSFQGGRIKKNINTNLNFKIDSSVNKTINNNMIGGDVSWIWLEGDTNSAPSYEYLKNHLAYNINELEHEFIKNENIECFDYKNRIRSLYIQVEKIINNSIINLIYFIVDYEPMSNYINFIQLFDLEEEYVNITQDENSGIDKIKHFIDNTIDGKKHSKAKNIIEDHLSEIYMDIDEDLLTEKFTEKIKEHLDKNYSLLFIFYLIQIIKIDTSNYVNDTILTKLDELTQTNEYIKTFIDNIKKLNESKEQNTYIICHIILHFYVGLSETWLDESNMFCGSKEATGLMKNVLTLNNLVDVHLCKLNEQIKKYMPKPEVIQMEEEE